MLAGDFFGGGFSIIDNSSLSELSSGILERFNFFRSAGDQRSLLDDDFSDVLEPLRCRFCEDFAGWDGVVLS